MDPFFPNRDLTNMEVFRPSQNLKYDRSMLHPKINHIFNRLVERRYNHLKNYAFICVLKGGYVRREYGDYACLSILEVCEELRKEDPYLFDKKSPRAIAKEILSGFRKKSVVNFLTKNGVMNMINQDFIKVHDAGIITFQLDGSWIAHRIHEMVINGIDTWAPILYKEKTRAIFVSHTNIPDIRAHCIKHALANMFLYSGIDVLVSPKHDVDVAPKTIWYGLCKYKADVIVYVTPHLHRKYIEEGFANAICQKWFRGDLAYCGYRSLSFDQRDNLAVLRDILFTQNEFTSILGMAQDFGYTPEAFFDCLLKYTLLKNYKLAEVTFSLEEMLDMEGNTFVNMLRTKARISSIINNSISSDKLSKSKMALAGEGERELGLHLVQFTWVIEKACTSFVPHAVCVYLFGLSKLFMSYCPEFGKENVLLCTATQMVFDQCLHFLGIDSSSGLDLSYVLDLSWRFLLLDPFMSPHSVEEMRANDHRFSQSRFELFTMRVFVAHPDFDNGSIFGNVWVNDANLVRQDGWKKFDSKDGCYVSYWKHEGYEPLDIYYGSFIPFGDPSCRRSVPISSSLELDVVLHAMSKNKQHCYLVFHDKVEEPISKIWDKKEVCPDFERGTLDLVSDVGTVQINYILVKEAMDASMEVLVRSSNPNLCVKIRGYIVAYYGDMVDDDILGRYKAVIFRTTDFKLTGNVVELPLHKSLLAVPANECLKIKAKLEDVASGKEYVRGTWDCFPGENKKWCIECGEFFMDLKVDWSG